MRASDRLSQLTPDVSMGASATFSGRVYPATEDMAACVQLVIVAGAAAVTIYPTADGLSELADMLTQVAAERRALDAPTEATA